MSPLNYVVPDLNLTRLLLLRLWLFVQGKTPNWRRFSGLGWFGVEEAGSVENCTLGTENPK